MGMTPSPCTGKCPRRTSTCHSECKDWLEYEEVHKKEKEEEKQTKMQNRQYCDYARERSKKIERRIKTHGV